MNTRSGRRSSSPLKTIRVTRRAVDCESDVQIVELPQEVSEQEVVKEDEEHEEEVVEEVVNEEDSSQQLIETSGEEVESEIDVCGQEIQSAEQLITAEQLETDQSVAIDGNAICEQMVDYWTVEKSCDNKTEFVCKWILCSFRTQSECSIRKHAVKHQKPFQCSFASCGERFVETRDLMQHFSVTHMDTNAFKCNFADCQQRFRDLKALTAHKVSHVSHKTQLIKAGADYKPGGHRNRLSSQSSTAISVDSVQIFGPNNENLTTIEMTGEGLTEEQFLAVVSAAADGQTTVHTTVLSDNAGGAITGDRYRSNTRLNSVIRCPISSLTDDIVEGNDNYIKCRTFEGKFWYKCLWDYCDYGNINEGIIRRHVQKHEFPHKCSFDACSKSFATLCEMAEHRQAAHSGTDPYRCDWPDCSEAFGDLKTLTEHKQQHLTEVTGFGANRIKRAKQPVLPKPFMCDFGKCNMHYATEEELEAHKQIHSGDRPFKCQYPDCTFAAKSKDKLQIHHSRHSSEKTFRCLWPTCDKSFTISEQLRRHRKLHTNRNAFICEFTGCDIHFPSADDLERHLRRHIGLDETSFSSLSPMGFKCNFGLCKMHFQTKEELQKHSECHKGGERLFKCGFDNKCSYSAKTLDKLTAHLRYHSGERPFKCDFIGCHQDFIQSHHLARHRKTHFGEQSVQKSDSEDKLLTCEYCSDSFDDRPTMEAHYESEHSIQMNKSKTVSKQSRKRVAEDSDQPMDVSSDLNDNDLTEELESVSKKKQKTCRKTKKSAETSGESSDSQKSISCSFGKCNFRCSTDEELSEHTLKLHSGERPFLCEFKNCTFRTNRKDKLTIHIRRHTGEKPYKCDWDDCERTFISKDHLNRHNLTHFKSKQTLSKMELIDKDFDRTLKELDDLLQETDANDTQAKTE